MAVAVAPDVYRSRFETLAARRAAEPGWLATLRLRAIERFGVLGLPTPADEEWRFTSVAPVAAAPFAEPSTVELDAATVDAFDVPGLAGPRLVFVNGRFAESLSAPGTVAAGVRVTSLASVLASEPALIEAHLGRLASFDTMAFSALNTAFADDGAVIIVPARAVVAEPIRLLYLSTTSGARTVSHPRTLVVVGAQAEVTFLETYAGLDEQIYLTNAVTEVSVAAGAQVTHIRVQSDSHQAFHVAHTQVGLERDSVYAQQSFVFGAAIARHDIGARLGGEGGHCTLNGLYLGNGARLVDTHTVIDHAMPHCESHEVYKGMLDGTSRGVFNGKILVRLDAQKTDAKQTNKVLLLSDDATINTKPQLEIFADDVKCTHGATVGQLDDTQLFYLRARGIGEADARAMLVHAFASEVIDHVGIEAVRAALESTLLTELPKTALPG